MPRRARWLLLPLCLAAGCPEDCDNRSTHYYSDSGRKKLDAGDLAADPCDRPGTRGRQRDEPVLAGTVWCPDIGGDHTECYSHTVVGPAVLADECLEFTGAGEVLLHYDRIPCDSLDMLLPDQFRFRSVTPDEVRGQLVSYLDNLALESLVAETGEFASEHLRPLDAAVLKLAADEPVHMAINLWAGDRRVAWSEANASLDVEVLRGEPVVALDENATVALQFPADSEATLTLVVGPTRVPLGNVRGVGLDTLVELEVVVAHASSSDASNRVPLGVRAVAYDGEGDLVYGATPEWEVLVGSFVFSPVPYYARDTHANRDYALLFDPTADEETTSIWCFPTPPGRREFTGRILARVGPLAAEVDATWTVQPELENIEDLYRGTLRNVPPGPNCRGPGFDEPGCECSTAPQGGAPLLALVLLSLGTARRRRRG